MNEEFEEFANAINTAIWFHVLLIALLSILKIGRTACREVLMIAGSCYS